MDFDAGMWLDINIFVMHFCEVYFDVGLLSLRSIPIPHWNYYQLQQILVEVCQPRLKLSSQSEIQLENCEKLPLQEKMCSGFTPGARTPRLQSCLVVKLVVWESDKGKEDKEKHVMVKSVVSWSCVHVFVGRSSTSVSWSAKDVLTKKLFSPYSSFTTSLTLKTWLLKKKIDHVPIETYWKPQVWNQMYLS